MGQIQGITPACAGKTMYYSKLFSMIRDHPRLRGKDLSCTTEMPLYTGSPPLARERLKQKLKKSLSQRITPACAGKTDVHSVR